MKTDHLKQLVAALEAKKEAQAGARKDWSAASKVVNVNSLNERLKAIEKLLDLADKG